MSGQHTPKTVGPLPNTPESSTLLPAALTRVVWALWVLSLAVTLRVVVGGSLAVPGLFVVDGLAALLWVVVTFFSGIVHSYSRRYLAGGDVGRFLTRVFAFTAVVMILVAADHVVLFGAAWLVMGLVMADLIGYAREWPQAQAAAALARRYFLASSALLGAALAALWWATGETTVAGITGAADSLPATVWLPAVGALVTAAAIQSALVPFHGWLLGSMTAPTPASALMHAGFVNAGGILLTRFAPVISIDSAVMLAIVVLGASSALLGKLLKSVQPSVKGRLGCSTVGQMGFMIVQVGLGFFAAAVAHLILHGFYKAYLFLSAGEAVEHTSPSTTESAHTLGAVGGLVTLLSALAGAALFALLTGKGTALDSGLLLTGLVALTTLHATREVVARTDVPATLRYGAVVAVFLPAIAVYALAYTAVADLLKQGGVVAAAPTELSVVHLAVAAAFLVAYVAIETGAYKHSTRLYAALVNASSAPSGTALTSTEDYNEY